MRRIALILICAMTMTVFAACDMFGNAASFVSDAMETAVGELISGDKIGVVGKDYRTKWFSFIVESIDFVDKYKGLEPKDGFQFVSIVVTVTGLSDETLTMGTFDFLLKHADLPNDFESLLRWDSSMMPERFELEKEQTLTYTMIFEIPEQYTDSLMFVYTELDVDENTGSTFTINFSK